MRIPVRTLSAVLAVAAAAAIVWWNADIWSSPTPVTPSVQAMPSEAMPGPDATRAADAATPSQATPSGENAPQTSSASLPLADIPLSGGTDNAGSSPAMAAEARAPEPDHAFIPAPQTVSAAASDAVSRTASIAQADSAPAPALPVEAAPAAGTAVLAQAAPPAPAQPATDMAPAAQAPAPASPQKPAVDETALRYFARQGDTRRLNAEIARLRSLYPDWVPPDDPLQAPPVTDPQLDTMWQLYSQGQFAAARAAIAARQTSEPGWTPPKDLLDRLAIAENRERLVNGSNAKQYKLVIDLATKTPSLLTCGDIDVLWRVAEAFVHTDRKGRTLDTYRYILANCTDAHDRLSTMQKAETLLSRSEIDPLLSLGHSGPDGDEFHSIREDLARNAVAAGGTDAKLAVDPGDLKLLEDAAAGNHSDTDALLLGNYLRLHGDATQAEHWFRISFERKATPQAAEGLALALIDLKRPAEAEAILAPWHDANEGARRSYMAAIANLLALQPPPPLAPEVLARIVTAVAAQRDAAAAQQLGWYAHAYGQDDTAARWFATALAWKPDDEPSAYGLAVVDQTLNRRDALRSLIRVWASRSLRIRALVDPAAAKVLAEQQASANGVPAPAVQPMVQPLYPAQPQNAAQLPPAAASGQGAAPAPTPYQPATAAAPYPAPPSTYQPAPPPYPPAPYPYRQASNRPEPASNPYAVAATDVPDPYRSMAAAPLPYRHETEASRSEGGSGQARRRRSTIPSAAAARPGNCADTLTGGWCLMKLNRPAEAVTAFRAALANGSPKDRQDAAYGLSLAYLRLGLTSEAAAASTQAPQPGARINELSIAILTQRIAANYQAGHYAQALISLDARARLAPEQTDLLMMRGWCYYHLQRYDEAQRVFQALADGGNPDAAGALVAIRDVKRER